MFESLTSSFTGAIKKLKTFDDINALKKALTELKKSLLKADVHHKVVKDLLKKVELETKEAGIGQDNFLRSIQKNLTDILTVEGNQGFVFASKPPTVILMAGLQGSGKTTTTGKLANYLKLRKKKVLIGAGDLQRMAAVEQLKQITAQIEIDLHFDDNEKDPVKIAKNAYKKAEDGLYDVLILDTAGRLAIDEELMNQLKDVKNSISVDEVFYVADSMTGHDTVRTALKFKEEIGIDGVILSKYDSDVKGGVALSIASQVGVPLRFIGTGEKIPDFDQFIPERIVNRLLGEGDVASLLEKTELVVSKKRASELNKKIKKGVFNFNDFLEQLESFSKLGGIQSVVGMLPGMGKIANELKDADIDNSVEMRRMKAIIYSMTPKERENPTLLNNSRKKRLAKGSGLSQLEVNKMLKQFKNSAKMVKKLGGKGNSMKDIGKLLSAMQNGGQMPKGGFPRGRR
jgi:signal recognition particle subunit SRP54